MLYFKMNYKPDIKVTCDVCTMIMHYLKYN